MSSDYTSLRPFAEGIIRDTKAPAGSRWRLRLHPGVVLCHVDPTPEGATLAGETAEQAGARARGKSKLFVECIKDGEAIITRSKTFSNITPKDPAPMADTAIQTSTGDAISTLAQAGEPEAAVTVARYAAESQVLVARVEADARVSVAGLDALSAVVADVRRMSEFPHDLTATLLANWTTSMEARIEDARTIGSLEAKLQARDAGAKDPTLMQELAPLVQPLANAIGVRIARAGKGSQEAPAEGQKSSQEASQEAPKQQADEAPDALAEVLAGVASGTVTAEDGALVIGLGLATRPAEERARVKALCEALVPKL